MDLTQAFCIIADVAQFRQFRLDGLSVDEAALVLRIDPATARRYEAATT